MWMFHSLSYRGNQIVLCSHLRVAPHIAGLAGWAPLPMGHRNLASPVLARGWDHLVPFSRRRSLLRTSYYTIYDVSEFSCIIIQYFVNCLSF